MERSNQSKVWEHFAQDGNQASCRLCVKTLCCNGGSTSGLSRHLKSKHSLSQEKLPQKKAKLQPEVYHVVC